MTASYSSKVSTLNHTEAYLFIATFVDKYLSNTDKLYHFVAV